MLDRATRKKELVALGAVHRAELVLEREALRAAVRPRALGRAALQHLAERVVGGPADPTAADASRLSLASLLPLVASGLSAVGSRAPRSGVLKMVLGGGALTGVAAGAIALLRRRKSEPSQPGEHL